MGNRIKMDGPYDSDVMLGLLNGIRDIWENDANPVSALLGNLSIWPMINSHYRGTYLYGLLVKENLYGTVVEDLQGYSKAELDAGRHP